MNIDDLGPEDQRKLLEELEVLSKAINQTYVPYPKQKLFHVAPNKIRAVFGGNRSGKSEMGTNEAKFHSTGIYPDWYPENLRWAYPTRGRIVVTDYKKGAGEVIEPKLKQWFGDLIVKIERSMGNISKVHVQHITGGVSTFDVLTHEQDTNQFEGWSGHWVWFDEPPPRDKYIACLRGLVDFDGRAWITATPITEPWLYDEIILNTARKAWHIAVGTYDNPHIRKESIDEFAVSLTDEEREARIEGKFLHLSGRIYPELDLNVHLIDNLPDGHSNFPTYFVLDPADRRPHHAIWAKIDPWGTIYVFDELVFKGTIKQVSEAILVRERTNGINPESVLRFLDPNKGETISGSSGLTLRKEFGMHNLGFSTKINDDIATRHLLVKGRLSYDKKQPISTTNHPKLYFVRSFTRECIRQLLSYVWDDWKGRNASSRSEKEVPKDLNKDMPDCVGYLCIKAPQGDMSDAPRRTFLDVDVSSRF